MSRIVGVLIVALVAFAWFAASEPSWRVETQLRDVRVALPPNCERVITHWPDGGVTSDVMCTNEVFDDDAGWVAP